MNKFAKTLIYWMHWRTPELAAIVLIPLALFIFYLTGNGGLLEQLGL